MDDTEYEDRFDNPEYPLFQKWLVQQIRRQSSCFERDILRETKKHLWKEWLKQTKEVEKVICLKHMK